MGEGINMTHHLLLLLLLLPLLTSVWGDADPWVDNDLYYGTVYQGEFAYSAGPTRVREKSLRSPLRAQAVERSYVEVPAAAAATYVQPAVEPAYLSHQYLDEQPTVFAAEYSPLPANAAYATDYQSFHLPSPYFAPYSTHTNYAAPAAVAAPAPVAAPVAAAAPAAVAAAP